MANQIVPGPFGTNAEKAFKEKLIHYFSQLYDNTRGTRAIDAPVTKDQIQIIHDKKKTARLRQNSHSV